MKETLSLSLSLIELDSMFNDGKGLTESPTPLASGLGITKLRQRIVSYHLKSESLPVASYVKWSKMECLMKALRSGLNAVLP